MRIFGQSLRSKLIGVFLLPMLVTVLLYGSLAYFAGRQGLEEELGRRLVSIGQSVSAHMSDGFDARQISRLDETKHRVLARLRERLEDVREHTGVRRVYIFDADHKSLVDTDRDVAFGQKLYALEAHAAEVEQVFTHSRATTSVLFEGSDGNLYKSGFAPIVHEGEVIAALAVEGSAEYFELLRDFASVLTVLGALAIALVVVVGTLFARQLTRPLHRLVEAAQRLGRGEWHQPVELSRRSGDEIDFLARAFDDMRRDIVDRDRQMQMMLSGIAHEVRNPLGGMVLFCGLLAEDLQDDTSPEGVQKLDKVAKIQRELDYLGRVVNDFLDFARNVPLELERFSARGFLDEIESLLGGEVVDAGCRLEVSVGSEDVELTGDRQKLRRAVINVVRNAYQACGGSGRIRVEVEASGDRRLITITDDGPGIDAERLDDILAPFFTTKEKGSGLGLALTQRILEQHEGELQIESSPGEGTTVRFVLPFQADVQASGSEIPEGWLG